MRYEILEIGCEKITLNIQILLIHTICNLTFQATEVMRRTVSQEAEKSRQFCPEIRMETTETMAEKEMAVECMNSPAEMESVLTSDSCATESTIATMEQMRRVVVRKIER